MNRETAVVLCVFFAMIGVICLGVTVSLIGMYAM